MTIVPITSGNASQDRDQILRQAEGWYTDSGPMPLFGSLGTQISGTIYGALIPFAAGDVVNGLLVRLGAGIVTPGSPGAKVVLTNGAGVILASSADAAAAFATAGFKAVNLLPQANGQPLVIPASGAYYGGVLQVATTTATIFRQQSGSANAPGGLTFSVTFAGQTDIGAVGTTVTWSGASALHTWIGAY